MGSRLWGTHSENSDWDLLVVTTESTGKTAKHSGDGKIDALVIDPEEYTHRCRQHRWIETVSLFVPKSHVVLQKIALPEIKLDRGKLADAVGEETTKDWLRAQKYVERGDLERAKRTIC